MKVRVTYIILFIYLFLLMLILNIWGIDALKGNISFEFYADSRTYMDVAKSGMTLSEMLVLNSNLIGPVYLARFFNNNYNIIFLFNSCILFHCYHLVTKHFPCNRYILLFFWILSPMMISSILSINKEILAVYSGVLALVYIENKKVWYMLFAIAFSLFVRWQQVLFILLIIVLFSSLNPFRKNLVLSFCLLLLGISVVYPLTMGDAVAWLMYTSEEETSGQEGTGLFFKLNQLQDIPLGYFLVFLPKFIFLLLGLLNKLPEFADPDNFYNHTVVILQCVLYLLIVCLLVWKRLWFGNRLVFIALVYSLLFTLSPIFAPRYLFLFYIFSTIAICEKKTELS